MNIFITLVLDAFIMFTKPVLSALTGIQGADYQLYHPVAGPLFVVLLIILFGIAILTRTEMWKKLPTLARIAGWLVVLLLGLGLGFCLLVGLVLSAIPFGSAGA